LKFRVGTPKKKQYMHTEKDGNIYDHSTTTSGIENDWLSQTGSSLSLPSRITIAAGRLTVCGLISGHLVKSTEIKLQLPFSPQSFFSLSNLSVSSSGAGGLKNCIQTLSLARSTAR
jgi:hypothetical protein